MIPAPAANEWHCVGRTGRGGDCSGGLLLVALSRDGRDIDGTLACGAVTSLAQPSS